MPFCSTMAIKKEVHVKSMVWASKISLNDGRYVIRPFECKIVGKAEGLARVRASIHTFFAIFDDEEWRIITLFVNHLDSKTKYTDLFAASCGSIGDFTDIKLCDEGYAITRQMKHFNFQYAILMELSTHRCILSTHSPFLKQPVQFLADIPKHLKMMVLCVLMGRGMGSPIPSREEGAWVRKDPKVLEGGNHMGPLIPSTWNHKGTWSRRCSEAVSSMA